MLKFTILGDPFGKQNMRPKIVNGHASQFNAQKNVAYMTQIVEVLNRSLGEKDERLFSRNTPVSVTIIAYFKIPNSLYKYSKRTGETVLNKKGQEMLNGKILPTKKPDLDNISKVVCDGISKHGQVWWDDSQVVCSLLLKRYDEKPRVEVIVEEFKNGK